MTGTDARQEDSDSSSGRDTSEQQTGFAWCSWHEDYSRSARLVRLPADQGSGHGAGGLFACAPCRHAYDLVPLADQPL